MNITSIKQQIKNADRVSISVDRKYSFSLTLNQLLEEKLKVGTELGDKRLEELKAKSNDEKFRMKALNWAL